MGIWKRLSFQIWRRITIGHHHEILVEALLENMGRGNDFASEHLETTRPHLPPRVLKLMIIEATEYFSP